MTSFQRNINAERVLLMLPLNVVMVARVKGPLQADQLAESLQRLRARHPFLGVRAELDPDGSGRYVDTDVPAAVVEVEERQSDDQWLARVDTEQRRPLPIESGPLVRVSLVRGEHTSELVICGHHAVCDGKSLGYLIRDLLGAVTSPETPVERLPAPPPIDESTVPEAPRVNAIVRWITGLMNKKWAARGTRFDQADMERMHRRFWEENDQVRRVAWDLDQAETQALVERCRVEGVTVNSALWAAFLLAQDEVHPERRAFRKHSALAVSTRDKLTVPVGEAFGFYASSLSLDLPHKPGRSLWDTARDAQARITRALKKTNVFRMLVATTMHPTLLDSLYFAKYGESHGALPRKLLCKMGWHEVTYGYAITNVGRLDIPVSYGPLTLEAVYGPSFYSDVEEKVVGVITVGGKLSLMLACNERVAGAGVAERLKSAAAEHLRQAVLDTAN